MLTVIAAVGANGVIGRDGDLACRHSDDMKHLRTLTLGHVLLMGRRTFDSIGRPLPGRRTVVLTRQRGWSHDGAAVAHTVDAAVALASRLAEDSSGGMHGDGTVFVFGGAELYAQLLDRADRLELTEIHQNLDGETLFPTVDGQEWVEIAREPRDGFDWVSYVRRPKG